MKEDSEVLRQANKLGDHEKFNRVYTEKDKRSNCKSTGGKKLRMNQGKKAVFSSLVEQEETTKQGLCYRSHIKMLLDW